MTRDPNIILSIINLKLRDFYESLDDLLYDLEDAEEMVKILTDAGYKYDINTNQFKKN